ncbi:MAG: hypothetical protein IJX50_02405 [Clostridia bacterium]|nr:hypothetical protein [Clostridia bacterium]
MEFFETVKQVASDVATVSAKQSKKLYNIAKLKLEVVEKQNIVKNLHKQIGIDAYEAYSKDADIVEAIYGKLQQISEAEVEIEELKQKIAMVKAENEDLEYVSVDDYEEAEYEDVE